ncbi:(Fe-S)-binding protein [Micromonospora lupini]|uniref:(Fe-S)-binding protein n=1 Tax=Micromonospora lupini TaxID=285679 RepID=UPI0033E45C09
MVTGDPISAAVAACSQCGLCLADCPTYAATGLERDSPRGRIQTLALGVAPRDMTGPGFDGFWGCLACSACHEVCPTGVDVAGAYGAARQLSLLDERK